MLGELIYFSQDEQNPVIGDHLLKGGKAVVLRQTPAGEMLTLLVGREETSLLPVREIPGATGGWVGCNSQNAMAAIAAAIAQNVPVETIRNAVRSFSVTTSLGGPSLGMAAEVYDADGRPVRGAVGELVIEDAWPAMTRGFWSEPDRYLATYWDRWEGVWAHGDWASVDEDGFWFLHGRSDDTLNIAGKRIGPAEVESVVVSLPEIVMAAAVGIPDLVKGEVVVVYAVPRPDAEPDGELAERVSDRIAATLGKAFRPAAVRFVPDLPRTRSAKIMRRVVKALVVGSDPGDLSSLENPESLEEIRRRQTADGGRQPEVGSI